jgi:glycosyltransferase involved in cell wall biosynthesis
MTRHHAKVLMVGPWPPTRGGVTTFMRKVVRSSLRDAYDFVPFTTSRPGKKNVEGDNYGYAAVLRGGLKRVAQGIFITLWHLASYPWIVLAQRPSVIQIQASDFQAFWEAALYVLMGKLLRRPVVMRIGGSFDRFHQASGPLARAAIRWTVRQPAVLLVQSEYWKNYVAPLRGAGATIVLPNFVSEALAAPRASPPPVTPRFLLSSGEVPHLKGAYVLLDAVRRLVARDVKAEVTIMAVPEPLRQAILDAGLGSRIRMLDFLEHDEALAALRETDVFLQISSSEGFPNALLEAMAVGCAAIVTPVGAVPEIVGADGECAFVIPVGDAALLAERMERLVRERGLLLRMAAAAQKRVLAHYTERKVVPVLDRAWQLAMSARRAVLEARRQPLA